MGMFWRFSAILATYPWPQLTGTVAIYSTHSVPEQKPIGVLSLDPHSMRCCCTILMPEKLRKIV